VMHFDPFGRSQPSNFHILKIQHGGGCHLQRSKNRHNVSNGLNDRGEIWHGDA